MKQLILKELSLCLHPTSLIFLSFAALVFAATVVISGAGLLVYRRVCLLRGASDHPVERGEEGQCRTDC